MKKLLFLNGMSPTGTAITADDFRTAFPEVEVIVLDDLGPIDTALSEVAETCENEHPDVIVGVGIGGMIAEQMALMMAEMGRAERQVISITHLPQIAAQGATHYKVYKEETAQGTSTSMLLLSDEERIREIAQMLSGSDVSDAAVQNAKELLKR